MCLEIIHASKTTCTCKCSLVHKTSVNGVAMVVSDSNWIEEEAQSGTG